MPTELCENRTKNDLDRALRQLLEQKPLPQIRVRELTALCGIRRQSFYYHFPDVYALFDWSVQQEAARLVQRQERCFTWQQVLADLLRHIARHRCYYQALLENQGRSGLQSLLAESLDHLLPQTLDYYLRRSGTPRNPDAEQTLRTCCETLLQSLLINWIQGDFLQPPEILLPLLETMIQQSAAGAAWQNLSCTDF